MRKVRRVSGGSKSFHAVQATQAEWGVRGIVCDIAQDLLEFPPNLHNVGVSQPLLASLRSLHDSAVGAHSGLCANGMGLGQSVKVDCALQCKVSKFHA